MDQQFVNVLSTLMSTDNCARRSAEFFFNNQLETNLEGSMELLLNIFSNINGQLIIRSFAGVLLRRAVEKYSQNLSDPSTDKFRAQLMHLWTTESNRTIIQRLSHILAQSALKKSWVDLLPAVITHSDQSNGSGVLPALNLIEIISDYCPEDIMTHLAKLGVFLGKFLSSTDPAVQVACAKATCACIIALEDDTARNAFRPALEPIIAVLGVTLTRGDETSATGIIENLVTVAQMQPTFFKGFLDGVVSAMISVASTDSFEFSTRSMALELMVTLTETAPALARRCSGLVQGLIPLAMRLMLEVEEEDADWAAQKYSEEPSEDENCTVGDEAVERIAAGLGGRVVAEPVLTIVQQYSTNGTSWAHRRAAIAGLCRLAEGCTKVFKKHLPSALPFLLGSLEDKSARVKYEGIQTIGRFAALFTDSTNELVDRFLPPLTMLLQDANTCDRVRGHAASALINLLNPEVCEAENLAKYLDPLLNSLIYCLQSAPLEVQAPCLVLLGCIAQVSSDSFGPYYNSFMPGIKSVLYAATAPDQAVLRGKAMECAGLVGDAVGVEMFVADAMEIMQLFIHAIRQDTERDITFEYILPSCARISKALGTQFDPFLQVVMEPLLCGAVQEIQFSMVDAEDDDVEGEVTHDDETGTESAVVSLGGGVRKRVTLNTHAVQQKNQAARIIYEFANSLRGHLRGYVIHMLEALLNLIVDKHSADIRSSAALALSKTFEAYVHAIKLGFVAATSDQMEVVMTGCLTKILEAVRNETDPTSRACEIESFRDILVACFTSGEESQDGYRSSLQVKPSLVLSTNIMKEILAQCAESLLRRKEKENAIANNAGYDAEDRETASEQLEEEEELLTSLTDSLGQLLKVHGEDFMPIFDAVIAPAFSTYLAPHHPLSLQIIAVCLVDDAIEFGGAAALKYIPTLLVTLLQNIGSSDNVLRQCSIYGIARAIYGAPEQVKQQLGTVLSRLVAFVQDPASEEEENEGSRENAIFGIGTLASDPIYREAVSASGGVSVSQLASLWLSSLPLRADEKEAKTACRQLCDAIERNDIAVTGDNYSNLQEILRVMGEVFSTELLIRQAAANAQQIAIDESAPTPLAHPLTIKRMQAITQHLTSGGAVPAQQLQTAFNALSEEQQEALRNCGSL